MCGPLDTCVNMAVVMPFKAINGLLSKCTSGKCCRLWLFGPCEAAKLIVTKIVSITATVALLMHMFLTAVSSSIAFIVIFASLDLGEVFPWFVVCVTVPHMLWYIVLVEIRKSDLLSKSPLVPPAIPGSIYFLAQLFNIIFWFGTVYYAKRDKLTTGGLTDPDNPSWYFMLSGTMTLGGALGSTFIPILPNDPETVWLYGIHVFLMFLVWVWLLMHVGWIAWSESVRQIKDFGVVGNTYKAMSSAIPLFADEQTPMLAVQRSDGAEGMAHRSSMYVKPLGCDA